MCGTDITVTLSVESQNANVDGKSYTRKTNSLFRYAEDTPAGTALIAYGRHFAEFGRGLSCFRYDYQRRAGQ